MSDVAERVRTIITKKLDIDVAKVVDSARFVDDLGADSLDTVEIVMQFEEEFGITIPDDDQAKILTVGDAISFIEAHASK
ncbi:MAG: acyl carrier protein [Holosporales bacterium]|jgi:acyl carrier protein|nr:acyl carrier protein [Holosporales bacterium]